MLQQNFSRGGAQLHFGTADRLDIGCVCEHNEDAIALCEPADQRTSAQFGCLYLLADGAGGHTAGEVASRLAVETIAASYYKEYAGMLTTCIAAVVKGNHILIGHVDDSRAYLLRSSSASRPSITCLTTDHSKVAELVRAGIILSEQMQSSPSRHMILRALGENKQDTSYPDMTTCLVQPGDRLVLCCDGLWSMLTEEQIAMVVSSNIPQGACAGLIRLANEAGGEDNMSAVVLSFL